MNAETGIAIAEAKGSASSVTSGGAGAKPVTRSRMAQAMQTKYDAMLHMVELMAALQCSGRGSPDHEKSMAELSGMISDARSRLRTMHG